MLDRPISLDTFKEAMRNEYGELFKLAGNFALAHEPLRKSTSQQ
jgi:hypothetical protein